MEITGILTFIGIFISIVLILISIAYYGIKEPTYDEAVTINSNETKKKSKKDISNKKQATKTNSNNSSSSTESKKRTSSGENNKKANNNVQEIPEEEDPIVIIPDPFTMQLSSRFAGATKNGPVTSGLNVKRDTQTQQVAKLPKQQQQKHKEDIPLENDAKKEIETENWGAFTIKTLEKIKPKATVKPNQNHVLSNSNISSDFQIKSVAVTGSVPQVQLNSNKMINGDMKASKTLDLVSNNDSVLAMVNVQLKEKIKSMENLEMTLTTKLKELSLDLTEKIKQIDALNKSNLTCKNEIAR